MGAPFVLFLLLNSHQPPGSDATDREEDGAVAVNETSAIEKLIID